MFVTVGCNESFEVVTDATIICCSNIKPTRPFSTNFFLTLNNITIKHHTLEKGAAIVEDLQQCGNYLLCKNLKVITDQKSIRYMYDNNQKSKIKNHKIR